MLPGFSRFLLVATVFCIAYGAGTSTSSLAPSQQSPPGRSPIAGPKTDFSGTYKGVLKYPQKGLYGDAQLVITGHSFTLTIESTTLTGGITSAKTRDGRATVTMVFESQPPASDLAAISLIGIKQGEDIWLASLPDEKVDFYFGTGRLLEQRGTGRRQALVAANTNSDSPRNGKHKVAARLGIEDRRQGGSKLATTARPTRVQPVEGASSEGPQDSTAASPPQQGSSPGADAETNSFSKLRGDANVVFTTPESMKMEETKVIELLVSPSKTIEELKTKLREPGQPGTGTTRYADRMEAQLTGTGFTITPISPAIQLVEQDHATKWMWQIKPKDGGAQRLDLTLTAVLNDGKDRSMVETFKRDINIKVSWSQRASSFVGGLKDLQWLWAAIMVPIAGAVYGWWRKQRKGRRRKK